MNILVTGGAGYIGSVTNTLLRQQGHTTVIFDNLSTGFKDAAGDTPLVIGDLRKKEDIANVFKQHSIDAVIHFAASALAGESMEHPAQYFENNLLGGLNLLEAMRENSCNSIVFSSTCAVYGFPKKLPVSEDEGYKPVSVYGTSKRMFEEMLEWYKAIYGLHYASLRYFNAAGAMLDGSLGESHPVETHIIPIALDVAAGKRDKFLLNGDDYNTPDGTCIRDYIHVVDLADAHILALKVLEKGESLTVNLGVGQGHSNREVIKMVEQVTGKEITVEVRPRRAGDPDAIFADNTKAGKVLGWKPQYSDLKTIIESAWRWHGHRH